MSTWTIEVTGSASTEALKELLKLHTPAAEREFEALAAFEGNTVKVIANYKNAVQYKADEFTD